MANERKSGTLRDHVRRHTGGDFRKDLRKLLVKAIAGVCESLHVSAGMLLRRRRAAGSFAPMDILEPRLLLTVQAGLNNGLLAVTGSEDDEDCRIELTADGLSLRVLEQQYGSPENTYDLIGEFSAASVSNVTLDLGVGVDGADLVWHGAGTMPVETLNVENVTKSGNGELAFAGGTGIQTLDVQEGKLIVSAGITDASQVSVQADAGMDIQAGEIHAQEVWSYGNIWQYSGGSISTKHLEVGGDGTYHLAGGDLVFTPTGDEYGNRISSMGHAFFAQTGGHLFMEKGTIFYELGSIQLQGGELSVQESLSFENTDTSQDGYVSISGGSLNVGGTLTWSPNVMLYLSAGEIVAGQAELVDAGATVYQTGGTHTVGFENPTGGNRALTVAGSYYLSDGILETWARTVTGTLEQFGGVTGVEGLLEGAGVAYLGMPFELTVGAGGAGLTDVEWVINWGDASGPAGDGVEVITGEIRHVYTTTSNDRIITAMARRMGGDLFTIRRRVVVLNRPAQAVQDIFRTRQPDTLTVNAANGLLINDFDLDGQPLRITSVGTAQSAHGGTVVLDADGGFRYTPLEHFTGVDTFEYTITDGFTTSTAEARLEVFNNAPVIQAPGYRVHKGEQLGGDLRPFSFDSDGDAIAYHLADGHTAAQHGTLSLQTNGTFTYVAANDFAGPVSFMVQAADGIGPAGQFEILIDIANYQPTVRDVTKWLEQRRPDVNNPEAELASSSGNVIDSAHDADNDTMNLVKWYVVGGGEVSGSYTSDKGSWTLDSNGDWSFAANAGKTGLDEIRFAVSDGAALSNVGTLSLHLMNIEPRVNDERVSVEHAPSSVVSTGSHIKEIDVLANDYDGDGDALEIKAIGSAPMHGTVTLQTVDGKKIIKYAATDSQFVGTDEFSYIVTDGFHEVTGKVSVTVTNTPPKANDDSVSLKLNSTRTRGEAPANTPIDADALAAYSNVEKYVGHVNANDTGKIETTDTITYSIVSGPTQQAYFHFMPDGEFVYLPKNTAEQGDSFTYRISDGIASSEATVRIAIPKPTYTANTDYTRVLVNGNSGTLNVFDNDSMTPSGNGRVLQVWGWENGKQKEVGVEIPVIGPSPAQSVPAVIAGQFGELKLWGDGKYEYQAKNWKVGTDHFTIQSTLMNAAEAQKADLYVDIYGKVATANDDQWLLNPEGVNSLNVTTLLSNDSDQNHTGNIDPANFVMVSQTKYGILTLSNDHVLTYQQTEANALEDSFQYKFVTGGDITSTVAVVKLDLRGRNFRTENDAVTTYKNHPVLIDVVDNDTYNGLTVRLSDKLVLSIDNGPAQGQAVVVDGKIRYTPAADFVSPDAPVTFTYKLTDLRMANSPVTRVGTVAVKINPVSKNVATNNLTAQTNEDQSVVLHASLLVAGTPTRKNIKQARVVDGPAHGRVIFTKYLDQVDFQYMPEMNYSGTDTFTYELFDEEWQSATGTATVTVQAVNAAPELGWDIIPVEFVDGGQGHVNVLANDWDEEGPLELVRAESSYGVVNFSATGNVWYTLPNKYALPLPHDDPAYVSDVVTLTIKDNAGNEHTAYAEVQFWGEFSSGYYSEPEPPAAQWILPAMNWGDAQSFSAGLFTMMGYTNGEIQVEQLAPRTLKLTVLSGSIFDLQFENYNNETTPINVQWNGDTSYLKLITTGSIAMSGQHQNVMLTAWGGDITGSINANDAMLTAGASISNAYGGSIEANIDATGTLTITAGANVSGAVKTTGRLAGLSAGGSVTGNLTAASMGHIRAENSITSTIKATGGAIDALVAINRLNGAIESEGAIGGISARFIQGHIVAESVSTIYAGVDLAATVELQDDLGFLHVERDFTGGISGHALSGVLIGRDMKGHLQFSNVVGPLNVNIGREFSGRLDLGAGVLNGLYVGQPWGNYFTSSGKINGATILAGAINTLVVRAAAQRGGAIHNATVTTTTGGINLIEADGDIYANIISHGTINVVRAGLVNEGNITGTFTSSQGALGRMTADNGMIDATIDVAMSVGYEQWSDTGIFARNGIRRNIKAGGTIYRVISRQDVNATISSTSADVKLVRAGRSIYGSIRAEDGDVGTVEAGGIYGGNIAADIWAKWHINSVLAREAEWLDTNATISAPAGQNLFQEFSNHTEDFSTLKPSVARPRWMRETVTGSIVGTITANGELGSLVAYKNISSQVKVKSIGATVWAGGDITGNITLDEGTLTVCAYGDVTGDMKVPGDLKITAMGKLSGSLNSHDGGVNLTSWSSIDSGAEVTASGALKAWAIDAIEGAFEGDAISLLTLGSTDATVKGGDLFLNALGLTYVKAEMQNGAMVYSGGLVGGSFTKDTVIYAKQGIKDLIKNGKTGRLDLISEGTIENANISNVEKLTVAAGGDIKDFTATLNVTGDVVVEGANLSNVRISGRSVAVSAAGNFSGDLFGTVNTRVHATGKIEATGDNKIRSNRAVDVYSLGDTQANIKTKYVASVSVFGSFSGGVEVEEGGASIEAHGGISAGENGGFTARDGFQFVTQGAFTGNVTTARGSINVQAGGNVSGVFNAGRNVLVETWGAIGENTVINAGTLYSGENGTSTDPTLTEACAATVLMHLAEGQTADSAGLPAMAAAVTASHHVTIVGVGDVTGKITARLGEAQIETLGNVTKDVDAGTNAIIRARDIKKDGAALTVTAGGFADVFSSGDVQVKLNAGSNASITAKGTVEAEVNLQLPALEPNHSVNVMIGAGGAVTKATVKGVGASVSIVSGVAEGAAETPASVITIGEEDAEVGTVEVVTFGDTAATIWAGDDVSISTWGALSSAEGIVAKGNGSDIALFSGQGMNVFAEAGNDLQALANGEVRGTFKSGNLTTLGWGSLRIVADGDITQAHIYGRGEVEVFSNKGISDSTIQSQNGGASVICVDDLDADVSAALNASIGVTGGAISGSLRSYAGAITVYAAEAIAGSVKGQLDVAVKSGAGVAAAVESVAGDVTLSAVDTAGLIRAGRDVLAVADQFTDTVEAGRDLTLVSGQDVMFTLTAGRDLDVTGLGSIKTDLTAGHNAQVFARGEIEGDITAGEAASVNAGESLKGDVTAQTTLSITAGGDVEGNVSALDIAIDTFGKLAGSVEAGRNIRLFAGGDVTSAITTPWLVEGEVHVTTLGNLYGYIDAGFDAVVNVKLDLSQEVSARHDLTLTVWENLNGPVNVGHDLSVSVWGETYSTMYAGNLAIVNLRSHATVGLQSGNHAQVFLGEDATLSLQSGGGATVTALGVSQLNVQAAGDVTLEAYDNSQVNVNAGGEVNVIALGNLSCGAGGITSAQGDVNVTVAGEACVVITAQGDVSFSGARGISGSWITTTGKATVFAAESSGAVMVRADGGVELTCAGGFQGALFGNSTGCGGVGGTGDITGTFGSYATVLAEGRNVDLAGQENFIVDVNATGDVRLLGTRYVQANVVATGSESDVMVRSDLDTIMGSIFAGQDIVVEAGSSMCATLWAGRDITAYAGIARWGDWVSYTSGSTGDRAVIGSMDAGRDITVRAWGSVTSDHIIAGRELHEVFALKNITGYLRGGERVGTIRAMGNIGTSATIEAGMPAEGEGGAPAINGVIGSVEALGEVRGSVTAFGGSGSIGVVKAGRSNFAIVSAASVAAGGVTAWDATVDNLIPLPPEVVDRPVEQGLADIRRQLEQLTQMLAEGKVGMELQASVSAALAAAELAQLVLDPAALQAMLQQFEESGEEAFANAEEEERATQEDLAASVEGTKLFLATFSKEEHERDLSAVKAFVQQLANELKAYQANINDELVLTELLNKDHADKLQVEQDRAAVNNDPTLRRIAFRVKADALVKERLEAMNEAVREGLEDSFSEAHRWLDLLELVDPTGIASLVHGAIYLIQGNKLEAARCFVSAIPLVGKVIGVGAKVGKILCTVGRLADGILTAMNVGEDIANGAWASAGLTAVLGALRIGSRACFTGDTKIIVGIDEATGTYITRNISEIREGDLVLTKDQNNPDAPPTYQRVTEVFSKTVNDIRTLKITDANGNVETIKTTKEHPFYVIGKGWTAAEDLLTGDLLEGPDGSTRTITEITDLFDATGIVVYNFAVENTHTYFVADGVGDEAPVWVHNTYVYASSDNKTFTYVGITDNLIRRTKEWLQSGRQIEQIKGIGDRSRKLARAIEHLLIENNGRKGRDIGGVLDNINRGIDPRKLTKYKVELAEARAILNRLGLLR